MKIAITADLHLTSREKHPERFHALENILEQLHKQNIHTLIIAGDLFDISSESPGEFEELIRKSPDTEVIIIPGNHDPVIAQGTFSLSNIKYISSLQKFSLGDSVPFVFIPYKQNSTVGEILAEAKLSLEPDAWILVNHGDWLSGRSIKNNYEDGTYMPLSSRDLLLYRPVKAFMGHIHAGMDSSKVHYPGSPCAMDPTEVGYHSYLEFNTKNFQVTRRITETDFLFFNEEIVVLPLDDEYSYIRPLLDSRVKRWNLLPGHQSKVRIRVKVRGYSKDRDKLKLLIKDYFSNYQFADAGQPDISQVKVSVDVTQEKVVLLVKQAVDGLILNHNSNEPGKDEIFLAALNQIYGGK